MPSRIIAGVFSGVARNHFPTQLFQDNTRAMEWLQRHFPDHRVHAVNFPGDPYPIHIDATFVPLRPGLIINNPNRHLPEAQRKIFEANAGKNLVQAVE